MSQTRDPRLWGTATRTRSPADALGNHGAPAEYLRPRYLPALCRRGPGDTASNRGPGMTALSTRAARLLAALPARRAMTPKRAAHLAGLPSSCVGVAVHELVVRGLVDRLGPALIRRSELSRMTATMRRLEGAIPTPEDEAG